MDQTPPKFARLTPDIAVAPQLVAEDFAHAAALGFRSIVNNRPDGEEDGAYMPAQEAKEAAAAHGLAYLDYPVTRPDLADESFIAGFREALEALPKPALAYCRSGARSTLVWALASAVDRPVTDIVERAAQAGQDLSSLRPTLEQRAAAADGSDKR